MWAPFEKRLEASRIALLSSAGLYLKRSQPAFDLEREQANPEWGDPSWRSIPAETPAEDIAVAHLHLNDEDILSDPEISLPARTLAELATDGVIGSATADHLSLMGYQELSLEAWRGETAPALVAWLREQQADGLVLAPA